MGVGLHIEGRRAKGGLFARRPPSGRWVARGALALALALAGCGPDSIAAPPDARPRYGDDWFAHRAATLGISPEAARARDAALPEDTPPEGALDEHTAREAAAIWRTACARCHGLDGRPPEPLPAGIGEPRRWGTVGAGMGFLFGGDRMRAGVYRTIRDGGAPKEDGSPSGMPAWGGALAREQMWALVRHIEGLTGE